ncbi:alpha/beta hydrolase [Phytoactinopolyspora limicola]|uniref:alpha/beta hydrolase n=1 Tax=Phytoactinopolyspora limicola TaxID=2715536 RepID=UPI00140D4ABB|nr:alpha/beta hydrolase [Phytoactinopolyspora limicola]
MNRRILLPVALAVVAAAACSTATPPDGPPPPEMPPESTPAPDATEGVADELLEYYTQTLEWDDCDDSYQCSTLTVPLDYDDPNGADIEIALLRVPATGAEPMGSLVINPGGPGASGIEYARNARNEDVVVSPHVRERFDVVGFDPRGVGTSTSIDCLDDDALDEFVAEHSTAETDDGLTELEASIDRFASACRARSGELLPHIDTANVARDLDVLRAALGDETLYYLGKSYGTFIGAVYADLFPERTGRLVLDGAVDPDLPAEEIALGQAEGFEQSLSAFITWCLDEDCPLGDDEQEARDTLDQLIADTEEEPLPTNDTARPLTPALAFYGIILPLYLPADEGYPVLRMALQSAVEDGDGANLLQLADFYLARNPDGTYRGNQNEAIIAVNCLDRPSDTTVEEARDSASDFDELSPTFGRFMAWAGLTCADWPAESDYDPATLTAAGAEPILVVGTTGDPATPYRWAESLAEQLESAVLLTYDAYVHTAYLSGSDCIDAAVDGYLVDGEVPEDGLVCS